MTNNNEDGMMNKLETPLSRRSVLKNVGVGAAAVAVAGVPLGLLASAAQAQSSTTAYTAILNLKYLTKALYDAGVAATGPAAWEKDLFGKASAHEAAHIAQLKTWIGSGAPNAPSSFNFRGSTGVTGTTTAFDPFAGGTGYNANSFYDLAALCEDLVIRAIKSQISVQFADGAQVTILAQMQSTDARHAAQMRILRALSPLITTVPAASTDKTNINYFKWLVYGPKESDGTTHPQSRGEDNVVQYQNVLVAGTANVFDEPLADFTAFNEFLGYFAA